MIGRRLAEHLGISGPAQPFITLRAVCRHIQEVSLLSPKRIFYQAVHLFIRCGDPACSFQIRINRAGLKGKAVQIFPGKRHSGHLHITEAIEGEMRAHMGAAAVGNVGEFRFCGAQVVPVEIAILQDFPVLKINPGPFFRFTVKFHPSCDFLTEIQNLFPCRRHKEADGTQPLMDGHRNAQALGQLRFRRGCPADGHGLFLRAGADFAGAVPEIPVGIIDFTVINIGKKNRRRKAFPVFIRCYFLL